MLEQLLPTPIRESAYRRRFLRNGFDNLFMGAFSSFDAARSHAPPSKPVGYDHAEAAQGLYSHQLCAWDYPALFWVADSLDGGLHRILDLGGHVGIKYYAFRRVLHYPADLRWTVVDVPCVVEAGQALARERQAGPALSFCTELREAPAADVLFVSGALQYLPASISQVLAQLAAPPRRIVLNITAVHPQRTFYTLNSIGFAVCPYRIQCHHELQEELVAAGYRRRDGWRNEGKAIEVPFVEGGDEAYYCGACFDRRDGVRAAVH